MNCKENEKRIIICLKNNTRDIAKEKGIKRKKKLFLLTQVHFIALIQNPISYLFTQIIGFDIGISRVRVHF